MRAGPAAWVEEYWDVRPGKLDEFIDTYRREVYSYARKVPGYRGYTFLTNFTDETGSPQPPKSPDELLTPHYGVHLRGETLTERAIDVGKLLMKTHNVVVVHHLRNWDDARAYRKNVEKVFAEEHEAATYSEQLAKNLYPLANNFWVTNFRLIETGLLMKPQMHSGQDAGGFNLDPGPSADVWFKEYFEVNAEDLDAFMAANKNNTLVVMTPISGYQGVSVVTTLPPDDDEAVRTRYSGQEELSGPSLFYVPQPGVMMDGTIRTDTSINYSLLFQPTFTIITYYQIPQGTKLLEEMQKNFEREHPGVDRLQHITKILLPNAQNHWDMRYRAIETSFVPSVDNFKGGD